jgi:excinuclease UvrABC nuclease subunit
LRQEWSEWLDFDKAHVDSVPEAAGVYLMHASMKVMHIGGSENIRKSLQQLLTDPCASKAKRFHYMQTSSYASVAEELLRDFKEKHQGKSPSCMEQK